MTLMTPRAGRTGAIAPHDIETVIVGGGQAGLAASYYLTKAGHPHVILERDRIGASWLSTRWDSFTLVTPNWMLQLPGFPPDTLHPDSFLNREEVAGWLQAYAESFDAPLERGVEVKRLRDTPIGFVLDTSVGPITARNVIVCTGYFHKPALPDCARTIHRSIAQVHSSQYRNPGQLPRGGVLVVGSGQSGAQIAEELLNAGRKTVLSVSAAAREPRTYRGRDINYWFDLMGGFDKPFENPADPKERYAPNPHCSGAHGGHALNLESFALDGMRLVGRVSGANGTVISFAPDMVENVRRADEASKAFMRSIDQFITEHGIDAPAPSPENTDDGDRGRRPMLFETPSLDLAAVGIKSIVWATGFRCDFRWIDIPVFDAKSYPVQERGISPHPGLYFCGQHYLHTLKSGLLFGVGETARHVTEHVLRRSRTERAERPAPRTLDQTLLRQEGTLQ